MAAAGCRHVEGHDQRVQRPWLVGAVGQLHRDQVAELREGLLDVAAVRAQPA